MMGLQALNKCVCVLKQGLSDLKDSVKTQIEDAIAGITFPNLPNQKVLSWIVPYTGARQGWWKGWSVIETANFARRVESPWKTIATRTNNSGEIMSLDATVIWGNHYILMRRIRLYLWLEWRVLVNGTPVLTNTYDAYEYDDERVATALANGSPPVLYKLKNLGSQVYARPNIPSGAVIEIQVQSRWQGVGAQASAYARYIGGLRSKGRINLHPQTYVIGRNP